MNGKDKIFIIKQINISLFNHQVKLISIADLAFILYLGPQIKRKISNLWVRKCGSAVCAEIQKSVICLAVKDS